MIQNIQKQLKHKQGLLLTNPLEIGALTNFQASSSSLLITKQDVVIFSDKRYQHLTAEHPIIITKNYFRSLKTAIQKQKIRSLQIDFQEIKIPNYLKLQKICAIQKISKAIANLRLQKNQTQIQNLKKAIYICEKSLSLSLKHLQPQTSEAEFQKILKIQALELKAEDIAFQPIVAFGKNTANIHHQAGPNTLAGNSIILIDLGFTYQNMCSDMTRTFILDKKESQMIDCYKAVLKAKYEAEKLYKTGQSYQAAAQKANQVLEKQGYPKIPHSLGHGIGTHVHETPGISPKSKGVFVKQSTVTCEPGVYIPDSFGIRIEDILYVQEQKTQNLNSFSLDFYLNTV